ncbi:MAG: hypothetical protein MUC88_12330 [Planctomycetes bacterium]|nr:hypothetical protein [Planctomycetota bacterium]
MVDRPARDVSVRENPGARDAMIVADRQTGPDRRRRAGFEPAFVASSNTNMVTAVTWFDQMVTVPGVLPVLREFSYHRYGGVSPANLQAIAARARQPVRSRSGAGPPARTASRIPQPLRMTWTCRTRRSIGARPSRPPFPKPAS